jgi:hypothetical protein
MLGFALHDSSLAAIRLRKLTAYIFSIKTVIIFIQTSPTVGPNQIIC